MAVDLVFYKVIKKPNTSILNIVSEKKTSEMNSLLV